MQARRSGAVGAARVPFAEILPERAGTLVGIGNFDAEILLHHLLLLVGEVVGAYFVVVGHVLEELVGVGEMVVHVAEVGEHRLAPGAEQVEIGRFVGDAFLAEHFAVAVVEQEQEVDAVVGNGAG